HVLRTRGSGQRDHPNLHRKTKNHLLWFDAQSSGNGQYVLVAQYIRIRSQQRKALVHDSIRAADLANLAIPAAICEAPILYGGGFHLRLFDDYRELKSIHVADADHARSA